MKDVNEIIASKYDENKFLDVITLCQENIHDINLENKLNLIDSLICIGDYKKSHKLIDEHFSSLVIQENGHKSDLKYDLYALRTITYYNENRDVRLFLLVLRNIRWLKYNDDVKEVFKEVIGVIFKKLTNILYPSTIVYLSIIIGVIIGVIPNGSVYVNSIKNAAFTYNICYIILAQVTMYTTKQFKKYTES